MSAPTNGVVRAAGALVWRVRTGHLQVALVHRPRYKDWSWPKGKVEPGESLVATAIREVGEETGLDVVLGVPLPGLSYMASGQPKQVHYWAAQVAGRCDAAMAARTPVPRTGTDEIDDVQWFGTDEAARRLTRRSDREPLRALDDAHRDGTLATRALMVVRHGRARKRAAWSGTEQDRPLTPVGQTQASALAPLASAFGVSQVVTSRWERCLQTVQPYTRASGLSAQVSDQLTEKAHAQSPAQVAAEVQRLLTAGEDSLLCTHRPVLPTVLDVLAAHASRPVADSLPSADPFLRPGHALVAHVAQTSKGPRVVAAQSFDPQA
ncbi:MAG: NUDIX hydrolase [Micrococcales bacterium]|nr:NUDIX hydrolase [Micrococcales bacterium]